MVGSGRRSGGADAARAGRVIRLQSGFGPPTLCLPGRHRSPFLGPFARNSPAALRRNGDHGVGRDVLRRAARDPVRGLPGDRRLSRAHRAAPRRRAWATRHDRRDRRRLGRLESQADDHRHRDPRPGQSGRRARPAAAAGGRGRRVDVGAGARPAAQGAHDRAARSLPCAATSRGGCTSRASRSTRTRRTPIRGSRTGCSGSGRSSSTTRC